MAGADVDALRRLVEYGDLRRGFEKLADQRLLLVTAAEQRELDFRVWGND